jgi:hypothetical protein
MSLLVEPVGSDDDRAALSEDELHAEEEDQVATVSAATVGPFAETAHRRLFEQEQKLLDEMTELAEASRSLPDARVVKLVEWIRKNMCPQIPMLGKPAKNSCGVQKMQRIESTRASRYWVTTTASKHFGSLIAQCRQPPSAD